MKDTFNIVGFTSLKVRMTGSHFGMLTYLLGLRRMLVMVIFQSSIQFFSQTLHPSTPLQEWFLFNTPKDKNIVSYYLKKNVFILIPNIFFKNSFISVSFFPILKREYQNTRIMEGMCGFMYQGSCVDKYFWIWRERG